MLSVSALSPCLVSLLSACPAVGFSGSRSLSPLSVAALRSLSAAVLPSASVFVGCAAGADAVARSLFPSASVFSVASGRWGAGRSAFARRSVAVVSAVLSAGGSAGLWCFSLRPAVLLGCCLRPGLPVAFVGWGLGLGPLPPLPWVLACRCWPSCPLVFLPLPAGVLPPWGVVGGWPRPAAVQLSLFA
ncbi:hypothetical protein NON20_24165 (plasmid) [Synechocystis sp. B12]|nr:hypothetical protein NON20_24165 [Synechocystis sp. B12]